MTNEEDFLVAGGVKIPLDELRFVYVKSSGPGGQNVNKVNSQAQLFWKLSESTAMAEDVRKRFEQQQKGRISKEGVFRLDSQRYRDREKNRQDCLDRLRNLIVLAEKVPQRRRKTRIPRRVREARLKAKRIRAGVKRDRRRPGLMTDVMTETTLATKLSDTGKPFTPVKRSYSTGDTHLTALPEMLALGDSRKHLRAHEAAHPQDRPAALAETGR